MQFLLFQKLPCASLLPHLQIHIKLFIFITVIQTALQQFLDFELFHLINVSVESNKYIKKKRREGGEGGERGGRGGRGGGGREEGGRGGKRRRSRKAERKLR